MAFLFKKKHHDKAAAAAAAKAESATSSTLVGSNSSMQGSAPNVGRGSKEHKDAYSSQTPTPTGSVSNSIHSFQGHAPSPDRMGQNNTHNRRGQSSEDTSEPPRNGGMPIMQQPPPQGPNASLYPWSFRKLTYTSAHPGPFPRYGAAINAVASKEGDIYMMGGLINSATVKGDLWLVEAGSGDLACYPLATTAEGPGPRVGHASLLVGNAFIVYGGDTKMDEGDTLDEALYLLNTSTRQWSRAIPGNPRPPGRYGHSLNILGSKVYVFGGQVEGFFMNDLVAFDLNQLQSPANRWEFLIPNEAQGIAVPPPRTNHSIITYNERLYLFGGTNGYQWFNDVWCYDPDSNSWSELPCIGYIPASREGHAAALVDDVMYIFGGRSDDGADLGDLAAFRISTRRWYTFQNMGPSPSPRSGHSMTAHGKQIIVLGGEPSTNTRETPDLTIAYLLDTTKIRYPDKAAEPQSQPLDATTNRRPSDPDKRIGARNAPSREGMNAPPEQRRPNGAPPPRMSMMGAQNMYGRSDPNMQYNQGGPNSKLPLRASMMQPPAGPPPPGMAPSRPTGPQGQGPRGKPPVSNRGFGPAVDTVTRSASLERDQGSPRDSPVTNGRRTPQSATIPKSAMRQEMEAGPPQEQQQPNTPPIVRMGSKSRRQQGSLDGSNDGQLKSVVNRPGSPPAPTRVGSNSKPRSARNSQTVNLLNELDNLRNRNAWMTSELELARKAGYTPGGTPGSIIDNRISQSFGDSERPLVEALIAMRNELANIQGTVDQQAVLTAKRIAEAEQQRDAAIEEAMYAKAKLNGQSGSQPGTPRDITGDSLSPDNDRSSEISKKLAAALQTQKDLHMHIDRLKNEIETEKRTRKLAEDTTNVAQARITELEKYKQNNTSEVESLKAELHQLQIEARDYAAQSAEATSRVQLLEIEKESLDSKLKELSGSDADHNSTFDSLRDALASSHTMKDILQRKLDEERVHRETVEEKLRNLRTEHEERTAELEAATAKLIDAEEMAEKHAAEAASLRQAVLSGLDRVSSRAASSPTTTSSDKLEGLQKQIENANALVRQYQAAANTASEKLRGAEERIAGLEAYQEQVSREGMSIRKQLQASMRDVQTLQAANSEMKARISDHSRETNALNIQYLTLKNLLGERGISPSMARGLGSPRADSPDLNRVRQLEQELISVQNEHEETKQMNAEHLKEVEREYQEKLGQLESDYQSAVHYVKGTEKMLKRMKEDLSNAARVNQKLKEEVDQARLKTETEGDQQEEWEEERSALRGQIANLQKEIEHARSEVEAQLEQLKSELEKSKKQREADRENAEKAQRQMAESFEQARQDLNMLQEENELLEQRALDAEQKVSLLLDQVENSVDNYRRQSHMPTASSAPAQGKGHTRDLSAVESIADSVYSDATARPDERNSMALDSLTSELENLRSHWESTNKNWRQSQASTYTMDAATPGQEKGDDEWRKRLDEEERKLDSQAQAGGAGGKGEAKVGEKLAASAGQV